jgi:cellulose synthase/poly-beta-1,6-N-acetylglucosamine synthase-like glycosyltransferase
MKQDYPDAQMEIIIVSDGSSDSTDDLLQNFCTTLENANINLKVISYRKPKGKAYALNLGVHNASGELIIFTDARQKFHYHAIRELVANFHDPAVGCVSGALVLQPDPQGNINKPAGMYWAYEKWIRKNESRTHSVIGATGAIYAVRKKLYVPIPSATILDDLFIPMKASLKGFRVLFDETAKAYDYVPIKAQNEFRRKIRTLTGNFQIITLLPELLTLKYKRILWYYFSHKILRLIVPYALIIIFTSNVYLLDNKYTPLMIIQTLFYTAALIGFLLVSTGKKPRQFAIPYTFVMLNCAALLGLFHYIKKNNTVWFKVDYDSN